MFDWKRARPLAVLEYHSGSIYGLDFRAGTGACATAAKDMKIALWDLYAPH